MNVTNINDSVQVTKMNWEDLIQGCRSGDRFCQQEIYHRSWSSLFPAVLRITRNRNEAEDIMQESMIKAFGRLDELKDAGAYPAWQRKISINAALNHVKKRIVFEEESSIEKHHVNEREEFQSLEELDPQQVLREMEKMPDGYRLVIQLFLVEDMSHEEIGLSLGIATATSRSQYSRAIKKLKTNLLKKHGQNV